MKPHNNLDPKDKERVERFLRNCGPYTADIWSNSYYSEILDYLNKKDKGDKN